MKTELFHKIIQNLKEMKFKGRITFNRFNEPLLDQRLPEFIEYTRKNLPKVYIYINTNGDMLNLELWKKLREAGLNYANISQYDDKINSRVQEIYDSLGFWERGAFGVHLFNKQKLSNWAGNIRASHKTPLKKICPLPFYQLIINYEGKTVLCCRDYFGKVVTGDINKEKIQDIWESKTFQHYRKHLRKKNRAALKPCDVCYP